MHKTFLLTTVSASLLISTAAFAQGKRSAPQRNYSLPPYGMAGCGLGSVIFSGDNTGMNIKNNTMGPQLLAATTNSYAFPQLSAITSGTSNCTDTPAGSEEAFRIERETYVSMNLGDLSKEASQGEGNHLRGLAEMIGCGNDSQFEVFAAVAQTEHDVIFSDIVASNVANRFVAKAKETDALQSCLRNK
jgi:hypothetical protein